MNQIRLHGRCVFVGVIGKFGKMVKMKGQGRCVPIFDGMRFKASAFRPSQLMFLPANMFLSGLLVTTHFTIPVKTAAAECLR